MPTITFHPDIDPESTSVDGEVSQSDLGTWEDTRGGGGDGSSDANTSMLAGLNSNTISRCIILFDTSSLPDSATIDSVNLGLYVRSTADNSSGGDSLSVVNCGSTNADTALSSGDFTAPGTTLYADAVGLGSLATSAFNVFALNNDGIAAVNTTGLTRIAVRTESDRSDNDPVGQPTYAEIDQALNSTGNNRPYLEVTYTIADPQISVGEDITLSESCTALLTDRITTSEAITVSESVTVNIPGLGFSINVSDSISVSESVTARTTLIVSVSDAVAVSEYKKPALAPILTVNLVPSHPTDWLQLVAVAEQNLGNGGINFERSSNGVSGWGALFSATDNGDGTIDGIYQGFDTNTGSGLTPLTLYYYRCYYILTGAAPDGSDLNVYSNVCAKSTGATISVNDSIAVSESVGSALAHQISVSDTISLVETATPALTNRISVSDAISLSDSGNALFVKAISVSDSVGISESLALNAALGISKFETVSVAESRSLVYYYQVNVHETIGVAESTTRLVTNFISVRDGTGLTELVGAATSEKFVPPQIQTVSVSDVPHLLTTLTIHAAESLTVSESIATKHDLAVALSESVVLTENVQTAGSLRISLSDAVSVGEATGRTLVCGVNKSESISVSESLTRRLDYNVSKSESVSVSENKTVNNVFLINKAETISITTTAQVNRTLYVSVSEAITAAENLNTTKALTVHAADTITTGESVASERHIITVGPYRASLGASHSAGADGGAGHSPGADGGASSSAA